MNLLTNPGFNDGHHHQDDIPEIVVPNGWYLHYLDNATFPGGDRPAMRPESVVWNIIHAPGPERPIFFLDGNYCWKVFGALKPVYFACKQEVSGLIPGVYYRFTAKVFPDIVDHYDGSEKAYSPDPYAAEARVGASESGVWPAGGDGDIEWSDWFNPKEGNMTYGQYGDVWIDFVATAPIMYVWLECKAKWRISNNFFFDAWLLTQIGDDPAPPEPGGDCEAPARVAYPRTYVLYPPDATLEEKLALLARYPDNTVGPSADDAIIGCGLGSKKIIAYEPLRWPGDGLTASWFRTYYPNTEFTYVVDGEPVPEPEPEPEPEPPPVPDTSQCLITPHVQSGVDDVLPFLARMHAAGKPPMVIKLFQWGDMRKCHAASPNIGFLLRRHWDGDIRGTWIDVPDVVASANRWVDDFIVPGLISELDVARAAGWNGICWVEVDHNELFACSDPFNVKARDFSIAAAHRLMSHNIPNARPAIFSAPVGNPELDEYETIVLPMARTARQYGGALTYHGYWAFRDGVSYLWGDDFFPYFYGRWTEMDKVCVAHGVKPLWIIGEMGVTHGDSSLRPTSNSGWRYEGVYDGNFAPYADELMALNSWAVNWNKTHQYRCISAGCIFTRGGGSKWQEFEMKRAQFDHLAGLFGA